ncbi:putative baseplate assembly protein [Scytonema sp. PRP1]|uniref:putative baseplate assembly protein n=1 Tax=Scytonema sp. PRP1 TaxID=3120513 RepID=UPI00300C95B2
MTMIYFCCNQRRREIVAVSSYNGIDYLEVLDQNTIGSPRQQTLLVRCFKPVSGLTIDNVQIEGGTRITPVKVLWAAAANAVPSPPATSQEQAYFSSLSAADHVLVVRTDSPGDFSTYRLILRQSATNSEPPTNFDPQLSAIDFSFKVECPSDFDCRDERICPPGVQQQPEIDYLAKDFASFRQLMLDRMALLMPEWQERNLADIGVTLVELLAYVGDHLSYQQDAIATEAYLDTARHRISVRRHARLVDYLMHDGCNARVWVHIKFAPQQPTDDGKVLSGPSLASPGTRLLTKTEGLKAVLLADGLNAAVKAEAQVFETMHDLTLYKAHSKLHFYTWGDEECCLPKGATSATLLGKFPNLKPGFVLIFQEVLDPKTGNPDDANPAHRHPVRLTKVTPDTDPLGELFAKPPNKNPVDITKPLDITKIEWAAADALPFALCLSAKTDKKEYKENVSVALGNIVLADCGLTVYEDKIKDGQNDAVPSPKLFSVPSSSGDRCQPQPPKPIPPRFSPHLQQRSLTQAARVNLQAPAAAAFQWSMSEVLPAIALKDNYNNPWFSRRDLLASDQLARNFVVEIDENGLTKLRFGDDKNGLRPNAGTSFSATYRVGNGSIGNVAAEAIAHIVVNPLIIDPTSIKECKNPLPAKGGVNPETIEEVRQNAPSAFRTQQRAVTPEDYAAVAQRHPEVQRAAATFRWTGSWRTVFVTVDRLGGLPVDTPFKAEIRRFLEKFRMAGYDLEVDAPCFVSLEIDMTVCVQRDYFRSDVKATLLQVFSNQVLPDGRRGVFHPDNFTFNQPVYLSTLYAAAQAVPGVASVEVTKFQRQGVNSKAALEKGYLELGRLEIARLDNDPNFPENGVLRLTMEGGK